ncbi:hypothetical protein GX48_03084 [Paracoccidioides brasiliensis]|nr:hypothetical protein GX48_03084 [Paracoccidioides brasiliensis]
MRLLVLNKLLFRSCSNGKNRKDREKERGHCHPVGPSKGDQLIQRHDDIWKEWLGKRQPSWVVPAILLPDVFEYSKKEQFRRAGRRRRAAVAGPSSLVSQHWT